MKNPLTDVASDQGASDEHKARLDHEYTTGATASTYRPKIGEAVKVPGVDGRCHVIDDSDPALLTVQNARGVEFKVGERSVVNLGVSDGG